jgi:hypothetical protein
VSYHNQRLILQPVSPFSPISLHSPQALNAALGLEDDDHDLPKMMLDVGTPAKQERVGALGGGGNIFLPSPMPTASDKTPKKKPWGVTLEEAPATPMADEEEDDEVEENEENDAEKGNAKKGRKGGRKTKKRNMAARKQAGSPAAVTPQIKQKRRSGRSAKA